MLVAEMSNFHAFCTVYDQSLMWLLTCYILEICTMMIMHRLFASCKCSYYAETLHTVNASQAALSLHASITDVESVTVEPLSTDYETRSQSQDELNNSLNLPTTSDAELPEVEPPSPSIPLSE